jgi:hypothetical protein
MQVIMSGSTTMSTHRVADSPRLTRAASPQAADDMPLWARHGAHHRLRFLSHVIGETKARAWNKHGGESALFSVANLGEGVRVDCEAILSPLPSSAQACKVRSDGAKENYRRPPGYS